MRVCLVSQEYPPETAFGGIGSQTWNKAHALVHRGHQVDVLSVAAGPADDVVVREEDGITVHRLPPPGTASGRAFAVYDDSAYWVGRSWSVAEYLEQLVLRRSLDVVDFPEYAAEGFAFSLNRTPHSAVAVVVQLHGPLALFTDTINWPEVGSRLERVGSFMEGEVIRSADALMSCSANIADFTARRYGVDRAGIEVVHCGVDTSAFTPRPSGDFPRRPTVLFLGNVAENKGVITVFEAVLRLRNRYPDIVLQIAGKGDELRAWLRERATSIGATANVEFIDFVAGRAEVADLYRQAHVFASPAQHEPGVANVYIEAMAAGLPVVAAAAGAAPEAVIDGQTGLLVRPRDVEETESALDALLSDPARALAMGQAGRRRAQSYFSLDSYVDRVLAVYGEAVDRVNALAKSSSA